MGLCYQSWSWWYYWSFQSSSSGHKFHTNFLFGLLGKDGFCSLIYSHGWSSTMASLLTRCKNVFLNGDLQEIYMEQPPGFVAQGKSSWLVCSLCKSLYGLKQAPRAWSKKFTSVVQQFGITQWGRSFSLLPSLEYQVYLFNSKCWWNCSYTVIIVASLKWINTFVITFRPNILANFNISWWLR